jgi:transposase
MDSPNYPDNLTDAEWSLVKRYFDVKSKLGGRPPKYGKRVMLDAMLYLLRTGCSWRHLPNDFPRWKSVYTQYRS